MIRVPDWITVPVALLAVIVFLAIVRPPPATPHAADDCPALADPATAPAMIRCWSDGVLVVEEPAYENGGHTCTADGRRLRWEGTCVLTTTQASVRNPPALAPENPKGDAP